MKNRIWTALIVCVGMSAWTGSAPAKLLIDFNSTTQDNGPHNEAGYQPYDAGHEVAADFVTKSYAAFDTTIDVTPAWPNTTDNRVQQMIDRSAGNDANWQGTKIDLITDFLGIDTRTGNGGNGNYDGVTGTPTTMTLTLSGLPAGPYDWLSYHHDTENVHASFWTEVSTDGGASFTNLGLSDMSSSSPGGNPANPALEVGAGGQDPATLPSTLGFSFTSNGADDVVVRFTPLAEIAVHKQIWGINGMELTAVPEPSTLALAAIGMLGMIACGWRRRGIGTMSQ